MAKKIRRAYVINGRKYWLAGDTEQEILDNAIRVYAASANATSIQGDVLSSPLFWKPKKHNFGQFAMDWFNNYSKPNVSTVTATTYERQLRLYILPALGALDIEDITLTDVQKLFNNIKGAKQTKVKCKNVLNMIFKLAVEEEYMKRNLLESTSFRLKGAASKEIPPYSVEEMRYLVGHIKDLKRPDDIAYLAIQTLHPLRLEEVLGLKWSDLDTDQMILHIRRAVTHPTRSAPEIKSTKTNDCRDLALSNVAWNYLKALPRDRDSDFIVGGETPFSYTQVRRMCDRIARETGFEGKITPIRFRTTVLTDIYEQTGDIKLTQKAAGHKTAETTLKHYIKGRKVKRDSTDAIEFIYSERSGA